MNEGECGGGDVEEGPEWAAMTPSDFDRDAPLCLNVRGGTAAVPAEPDEYGTAPLFGSESPARSAPRRARRPTAPADQGRLF
ncbi:hypothetical protein [Streptomyces minutiscleroticus]|uniref:Uncharacterized protein n=1 Tax=Streptomyces minutiscleroticus TaxID=68238 RepID=A0A918NPL6_9ACTN|nr:hypothetical protein [Streptomyces minutiscleroticus]GGX85708.1 hypothetical protein GCM10010358_44930 [Streptomyces minutiscleroticus]